MTTWQKFEDALAGVLLAGGLAAGWFFLAALEGRKRRRLSRAWRCWLADHPDWQECSVELVCALVPLPPLRGPVRWVRWG